MSSLGTSYSEDFAFASNDELILILRKLGLFPWMMSKISGIASKSSPGFFMTFDFVQSRLNLQDFDFERLFRDRLNWSNPTVKRVETIELNSVIYKRRMIAQVAGVAVYEVVAGQVPDAAVRQEIYRQTVEVSFEHLLIFVDEDRSQSYWY